MATRWWPTTIRELLWEMSGPGDESWIASRLQRLFEAMCRRWGHVWGYRGRTSYHDRRADGDIIFHAAGRGCKRCLWFHLWTWGRQGLTQAQAERQAGRSMSGWPVPGTYWLRTHDGPPSDLKEASHEQL